METIQVVLDKELLLETDRAAQDVKQNRSQLVREALRLHLYALKVRALEKRECEGYLKTPQTPDEFAVWDKVQVWPEE